MVYSGLSGLALPGCKKYRRIEIAHDNCSSRWFAYGWVASSICLRWASAASMTWPSTARALSTAWICVSNTRLEVVWGGGLEPQAARAKARESRVHFIRESPEVL